MVKEEIVCPPGRYRIGSENCKMPRDAGARASNLDLRLGFVSSGLARRRERDLRRHCILAKYARLAFRQEWSELRSSSDLGCPSSSPWHSPSPVERGSC